MPFTSEATPEVAPNGNGNHQPATTPDLIQEAEAIRSLLQDALQRLACLTSALKLQRRQSRALQAAMASLSQLNLDR